MVSKGDDPSREWYEDLGPDLSQGDIVNDVPWGLIDAPLLICQPPNSEPRGRAPYYPIDELPRQRSVQYVLAKYNLGRGIILWPDCQIDKLKNQGKPEKKWFAGVAPVLPLSTLDAKLHDRVLSFRRAQWFPLPAKPTLIPENAYIDLRYVWPLRYELLKSRVIALSEQGRRALALHRFWFDTEARAAAEVECPHCHQPIDSSVLFQRRGEEDD